MGPDEFSLILKGPDGFGWVQMDSVMSRCFLVGPNGFCYVKMVPGGSKWILMGQDGS